MRLAHRRSGLAVPHLLGGKPDAFGKVQPHVTMSAAFYLFFGQVAQNGAAKRTVLKAAMESAEEGGVGGNEMKVFSGVGAQMLEGELAATPCLVKRMSEQIVACHTRVER